MPAGYSGCAWQEAARAPPAAVFDPAVGDIFAILGEIPEDAPELALDADAFDAWILAGVAELARRRATPH